MCRDNNVIIVVLYRYYLGHIKGVASLRLSNGNYLSVHAMLTVNMLYIHYGASLLSYLLWS